MILDCSKKGLTQSGFVSNLSLFHIQCTGLSKAAAAAIEVLLIYHFIYVVDPSDIRHTAGKEQTRVVPTGRKYAKF